MVQEQTVNDEETIAAFKKQLEGKGEQSGYVISAVLDYPNKLVTLLVKGYPDITLTLSQLPPDTTEDVHAAYFWLVSSLPEILAGLGDYVNEGKYETMPTAPDLTGEAGL